MAAERNIASGNINTYIVNVLFDVSSCSVLSSAVLSRLLLMQIFVFESLCWLESAGFYLAILVLSR